MGKTARNAYTRGAEHAKALEAREQRSVLWTNCKKKHIGATQDFTTSIKKVLYRDAMLRQVTEAVTIKSIKEEDVMNLKTEWNFTCIPRAVIERGYAQGTELSQVM